LPALSQVFPLSLHDALPISSLPWPPRGRVVGARAVAEVLEARAVGVHHVDLRVAVTGAHKGDLRAVGRPDGAEVAARVGELCDARAVGIHHADVAVRETVKTTTN